MSASATPITPAVGAPACKTQAQGPGCPPPAGCVPGGPEHGKCCLHLLPPHARECLNLTTDQQKQLTDLEGETKAKRDKILTPAQLQQLKQMQPPQPKGGHGCDAPGGHAPAKVCPSNAPKTPVPTV